MSKKTWKAYRFELVFFNSGENRWQVFQELPSPESSGNRKHGCHHQQIHELLRDLRNVLKKTLVTPDSPFACDDKARGPKLVPLSLESLFQGLSKCDSSQEVREQIVDEIKASYDSEGIKMSASIVDLLNSTLSDSFKRHLRPSGV